MRKLLTVILMMISLSFILCAETRYKITESIDKGQMKITVYKFQINEKIAKAEIFPLVNPTFDAYKEIKKMQEEGKEEEIIKYINHPKVKQEGYEEGLPEWDEEEETFWIVHTGKDQVTNYIIYKDCYNFSFK